MEQKVERKPLLSDDEIERPGKGAAEGYVWEMRTAKEVRDWYEAAIDRGELVIPKTARWERVKLKGRGKVNQWDPEMCSQCHNFKPDTEGEPVNFCPNCGARITE